MTTRHSESWFVFRARFTKLTMIRHRIIMRLPNRVTIIQTKTNELNAHIGITSGDRSERNTISARTGTGAQSGTQEAGAHSPASLTPERCRLLQTQRPTPADDPPSADGRTPARGSILDWQRRASSACCSWMPSVAVRADWRARQQSPPAMSAGGRSRMMMSPSRSACRRQRARTKACAGSIPERRH